MDPGEGSVEVGPVTIIADDLTGAADCGLQARRRGLRTVVALGTPGTPATRGAAAVAWDVDARAGSRERARDRTLVAARGTAVDGALYVKVDSSLRGHVGAAVDAALEGVGAGLAVVAPAFPSMGRTTRSGTHSVETPGRPASAMVVDLLDLLRTQSEHDVHHLGLQDLRSGGVGRALGRLKGSGPWLLAADSVEDRDLRHLVRGVRADGRPVVWVGSAGLAAALLDDLVGPPPPPGPLPRVEGALLVVSGSLAPEALAQVVALRSIAGVTAVAVDPRTIDEDDGAGPGARRDAAARLAEALSMGGDALLCVEPGPAPAGARVVAELPLARIADRLGEVVAAAVAGAPIGGLLLTGGATARSVSAALGIDAIELLGEVAPGVPVGRAVGRDLLMVTKAGAFGPADALASARRTLRRSP